MCFVPGYDGSQYLTSASLWSWTKRSFGRLTCDSRNERASPS